MTVEYEAVQAPAVRRAGAWAYYLAGAVIGVMAALFDSIVRVLYQTPHVGEFLTCNVGPMERVLPWAKPRKSKSPKKRNLPPRPPSGPDGPITSAVDGAVASAASGVAAALEDATATLKVSEPAAAGDAIQVHASSVTDAKSRDVMAFQLPEEVVQEGHSDDVAPEDVLPEMPTAAAYSQFAEKETDHQNSTNDYRTSCNVCGLDQLFRHKSKSPEAKAKKEAAKAARSASPSKPLTPTTSVTKPADSFASKVAAPFEAAGEALEKAVDRVSHRSHHHHGAGDDLAVHKSGDSALAKMSKSIDKSAHKVLSKLSKGFDSAVAKPVEALVDSVSSVAPRANSKA